LSREDVALHRPERQGVTSPWNGPGLAEPYFLGLGRAMVSLGPLRGGAFCPFRCRFCYVHGPYLRYASRSVEEIIDWLRGCRQRYDIVYVSGDTDSFARPRTAEGLRLLSQLAELNVDVLFTTRYVFTDAERRQLRGLFGRYRAMGRLLVACVSVAQLSHPRLEPPPVPSPLARLRQARWLHDEGSTVLLTIRPFIPYVSDAEYAEIARLGGPHCAAILGGDWHVDQAGRIDLQARRALGVPDRDQLDPAMATHGPLDSTNDGQEWLTYHHPAAAGAVGDVARRLHKKLFMRSAPAVDFVRRTDEHR
jgi:hypothetical protein